jgi:hypothetical protein
MFEEPARKPGRVSAANRAAQQERTERRRGAYEKFLAVHHAQTDELAELRWKLEQAKQSAAGWKEHYEYVLGENNKLRENANTSHTRYELALEVFLQLAYLINDSELLPNLQRIWNGGVSFSSSNKLATFEQRRTFASRSQNPPPLTRRSGTSWTNWG